MTAYVVRRVWQMIPTILGVILLIFVLFNWVGGDPAQVLAGKISNPDQIANIRRQLGVDQPYWYQLLIFVKQVFTFDFGRSWSTNEEVSHIILTRIGPTLTIMLPVLAITTGLAVLFAVMVAYVRGTLTDRAIMIVCTVAMSVSFLVYIIVFQWLFGFVLGWFPVQGWARASGRTSRTTRRSRSCSRSSWASRRNCASTARSSWTRSTRITSAPRVRRASRRSR